MKKILSFMLVFVLLTFMSVSVYSLTEAERGELRNFGIMTGDPDGNLRTEEPVTRAEAVKMLCVAGGLAKNQACTFPDVSKEHWAYDYIGSLQACGIVAGDENGCFNPERKVTNEEFIKMIVSLLGYAPMAEMRGGFPAGYTATASQIGLTTDMQFSLQTPAVRKNVAKIICHALEIPIMQERTGSDGAVEFVIMDGRNGSEQITLKTKLMQ